MDIPLLTPTTRLWLSLLATALSFGSFGLYLARLRRTKGQASLVSWGIWAVSTSISAASYVVFTRDWRLDLLPVTEAFFCVVTALAILGTQRKHATTLVIGWLDWTVIALVVCSLAGWGLTRSAILANVLVQVAIVLGFLPTFRAAWRDPAHEPLERWALWTASYVCLGLLAIPAAVLHPWALGWPVLAVFEHGTVTALSVRRRRL